MNDMDHSRYHYARGRPFCGAGFPYDASRQEPARAADREGRGRSFLTWTLTWAFTICICGVMFSAAAWNLQWVMHGVMNGAAHGVMQPVAGR